MASSVDSTRTVSTVEQIAQKYQALQAIGFTPEVVLLEGSSHIEICERLRPEDELLIQGVIFNAENSVAAKLVASESLEESRAIEQLRIASRGAHWIYVADHVDRMRTTWFGGHPPAAKHLISISTPRQEEDFRKDVRTLCSLLDECEMHRERQEFSSQLQRFRKTERMALINFNSDVWQPLINARLEKFQQGSPLLGSLMTPTFREKELPRVLTQYAVDQVLQPGPPVGTGSLRFQQRVEQLSVSDCKISTDMFREALKESARKEDGICTSLRQVKIAKLLSSLGNPVTVSDLTAQQKRMTLQEVEDYIAQVRKAARAEAKLLKELKEEEKKSSPKKEHKKPQSDVKKPASLEPKESPASAEAVLPKGEDQVDPIHRALIKMCREETIPLHSRVSRWFFPSGRDQVRGEEGYRGLTEDAWQRQVRNHVFPRLGEFVAQKALTSAFTFHDYYVSRKTRDKVPYQGIIATQIICSKESDAAVAQPEEERALGMISFAIDPKVGIYHAYFSEGVVGTLSVDPGFLERLRTEKSRIVSTKAHSSEEGFIEVGTASFEPAINGDNILYRINADFEGKQVSYIFHRLLT